jgi:hypothetical protein
MGRSNRKIIGVITGQDRKGHVTLVISWEMHIMNVLLIENGIWLLIRDFILSPLICGFYG